MQNYIITFFGLCQLVITAIFALMGGNFQIIFFHIEQNSISSMLKFAIIHNFQYIIIWFAFHLHIYWYEEECL